MAPGKRTKGRGNKGSSTTSSDLGELALCFSEKDDAEQRRREMDLRRRRWWRTRRCCCVDVEEGILGFKKSEAGFKFKGRDGDVGEGMSCASGNAIFNGN